MSAGIKHKAVATWLALGVGAFGLHRFYLHGPKDRWGWLFPLPTLLGLVGVQRMNHLGQDDRLAWVLIPLLGISLVAALIGGIVYGLTAAPSRGRCQWPGKAGSTAVARGAVALRANLATRTAPAAAWNACPAPSGPAPAAARRAWT